MERRRSAIRAAVVWEALEALLHERRAAVDDARPLHVVDVGGGTGGLAVRIAGLGHRVTVVDPSPDALASLARRAAEASVEVEGLLGDADALLDVAPAGSADVVLCHGLLEVVEQPQRALAAVAAVLAEHGTVSVVAAQTSGAVLGRAVAGHLAQARALLDAPEGRVDASDPAGRRFDQGELRALLTGAGLTVTAVRGVRVFADLISSTVVESDPAAADELLALEAAVADRPEFMAVASQLHLLARRD